MNLAKQVIRVVPNSFKVWLSDFLRLIILKFDKAPYSAYIYALENCFMEFRNFSEYDQILLEAFDSLALRCTRSLMTTKE